MKPFALAPARLSRRTLHGLITSAVAAAGVSSLPEMAFAASPPKAGTAIGGLRVLPPDAAPFDAGARRDLALDSLTYLVRQQGWFPGRSAYLLPAAPWFGGYETPQTRRAWDAVIPGGLPLYLMANARDDGQIDPTGTTITVNGEAVPGLAGYVHGGVYALSTGRGRDFSVLDLVIAPPAPGQYHVEVRTKLQPSPTDGAQVAVARVPQSPIDETVLAYDLRVLPADALSAMLLRDPSGNVFAIHGPNLRRVPDPETLQALGVDPRMVLSASPDAESSFSIGPDLPSLRDGSLIQSENSSILFRLQGGRRVWVRYRDSVAGDDVRSVEAAVAQSIPPQLVDDLLLRGAAPDVFHVDKCTLRKIPDWKWVQDRGLNPDDLIYVPDRIVATLPQNSPEWRLPGGTVQDRFFYSNTLLRQMPYRVYLPAGYDSPKQASQRYPVVYLLHGVSGRYDEWDGYGASEIANELYYDGKFPAAIMVMPQGGLGYWMNQEGATAWADYVAKDVVGHVDATYRTISKREARAIGGISMGAHGALQITFNNLDVFGIIGAHSPSIRPQEYAPAYFGTGASFARRDPISLAQSVAIPTPPQIWIDSGDQDVWRTGAETLHKALDARGWTHEWHLFSGDHDGWYWGDHMWEYLPYYAQAFQKNGLPLQFK